MDERDKELFLCLKQVEEDLLYKIPPSLPTSQQKALREGINKMTDEACALLKHKRYRDRIAKRVRVKWTWTYIEGGEGQ